MSDNKEFTDEVNRDQPNWKLYNEILEKEDIGPFINCMTCGKCVGDCIAAENSDFNSRKIIQKILDGDRESLINGNEIWKCFLCDLCTIKCPKNIQIKKLILILRKLAISSGKGFNFLQYISDFPKSFLKRGIIVGKLNASLREKLDLPKEYNISDKALKELKLILEKTGQKQSIQEFLNHFTG
ncbi:MAG TPA: 4Fe-4S dicluster domain-containing protein [Candidatus Deferrimicrobium sp.]|nr:4Fe-4S dicluster domain-containing protein [Candidatus Deferrimicrobium sp.]